jgi:hypothetical protein
MKPEDFEQRLQRQPLRQVPGEWRADILDACRVSKVESRGQEQLWPSTLVSRLSALLWPHPKAWAGLAAVWILILAVDFSTRDKTPVVAEKSTPPSPEVVAELKLERRMLAELIGAREPSDADRSKLLMPLPRSERAGIAMV